MAAAGPGGGDDAVVPSNAELCSPTTRCKKWPTAARVGRVSVACAKGMAGKGKDCLLYTSPSPRDGLLSRMPSSA